MTEETDGTLRLFDSLSPENINADFFPDHTALPEDGNASFAQENTQQLAQILYEALCQAESLPDTDSIFQNGDSSAKFSQTVSAAEKFLSKLKYFMELVKCDLPVEAMFITPGDLAYHAVNLEKQGECSLKRI